MEKTAPEMAPIAAPLSNPVSVARPSNAPVTAPIGAPTAENLQFFFKFSGEFCRVSSQNGKNELQIT